MLFHSRFHSASSHVSVCVDQIRLVNSRFLMRLADVNRDDIGDYTCVVYNDFGHLNWTRTLDVIGQSRH